jgi:hypothetical protein
MKKFEFSKELRTDLASNGKAWDELLFKACLEAKQAGCKAKEFATVLRATGFRCGTGPARAAFKAVRDSGDQKEMVAAINAVRAKRKATANTANTAANTANTAANTANTAANTANTAANTANTAANTANTAANTANTGADTLVGVLMNAVRAAEAGKLEVAETWLNKARAMLDIARIAAARRAS